MRFTHIQTTVVDIHTSDVLNTEQFKKAADAAASMAELGELVGTLWWDPMAEWWEYDERPAFAKKRCRFEVVSQEVQVASA